MARKAKPRIRIETNGTYKGTKLFINDVQTPFDALHFVGDKNIDFDLVISLFQSKATKQGSKDAVGPDAIGLAGPCEEDEYYDDEDYEDE